MAQRSKKSILIIGGGGRETTLVYGYGKSPAVQKIFAAPGNDLMQDVTRKPVTTFPTVKTTDVEQILSICRKQHIDLVDIAQDNAVAVGLGDALERESIPFMGPKKAAGQIEWDKAWARKFMAEHDIPHPDFQVFSDAETALRYIAQKPDQPWVVKASGLAEGKGVVIAQDRAETVAAIHEMKRFGSAGTTFLLEQFLKGEEFSLFVISDGTRWQIIGSAQDHKRVGDGDEGLNTGGMGCSSPPLLVTPPLLKKISAQIIERTIRGMRKIGRPYTGILYLGGMLVGNTPYVIEFNARWGDPEAQVVIPSLQTDLFAMSQAVAEGDIRKLRIRTDHLSRVAVAGVSNGYPSDYAAVKGKRVFGLRETQKIKGVRIFGAGIQRRNGKEYAHGGRLFYVVGEGKNVIEARRKAYETMSSIYIEGNNLRYRMDIGYRDVERLCVRKK